MRRKKLNIREILYVSLHFMNGESIGYRPEKVKRVTNNLALNLPFAFAVINVTGKLPLIVRDIRELYCILDV